MSVEGIQELAKHHNLFDEKTYDQFYDKLDGHTHIYEYIWMNRFYGQTMQANRFKVDKKVAKVCSSYVQQYLQCAISVLPGFHYMQ